MVMTFQAFAHSIYNGWALFGCLAYTVGVYLFSLEKLVSWKQWRLLQISSAICVLTAAYLIIIGLYQAIDWVNPFAGKDVSGAIHNPKGWIIVAMIVVWPYLLIIVGLAMGHVAQREFRSTTKLLGMIAKKA